MLVQQCKSPINERRFTELSDILIGLYANAASSLLVLAGVRDRSNGNGYLVQAEMRPGANTGEGSAGEGGGRKRVGPKWGKIYLQICNLDGI